jgi:hypothetical protein
MHISRLALNLIQLVSNLERLAVEMIEEFGIMTESASEDPQLDKVKRFTAHIFSGQAARQGMDNCIKWLSLAMEKYKVSILFGYDIPDTVQQLTLELPSCFAMDAAKACMDSSFSLPPVGNAIKEASHDVQRIRRSSVYTAGETSVAYGSSSLMSLRQKPKILEKGIYIMCLERSTIAASKELASLIWSKSMHGLVRPMNSPVFTVYVTPLVRGNRL